MSSYGEVTAAQIASKMPTSFALQSSATGNGNGAYLPVTGYATAILSIDASGMSGGTTINFEGTTDGVIWTSLLGTLVGTTTTAVSTTAPGDWALSVAGYAHVRGRISAYSAGTITVTGYTSVLSGPSVGGGSGGGAVTQSGAWQVMLLDSGGANKASISSGGAVQVDGTFWQTTQPVSGTFWQSTQPVSGTFWQSTQPVSGTFWQTTQPVSVSSLPLPSGAATSARQAAPGTAGSASSEVVTVQGISSMTPLSVSGTFWQSTQPVSGTFWQSTQPVSVSSLPLPSGAATSARQAAPGSAGSASSEVVTVQGISSMTPLSVSGTFWQATQPVSGTFWQTTQPVSASSWPLPTGAATSARQAAPGTAGTASSEVVTVQGISSMTPLSVSGTFWQATQPVSASSLPLPSGAATSARQAAPGSAGSASSEVLSVQGISSMTPLTVAQSASLMPAVFTLQTAVANGNGNSLNTAGYATAILNITVSTTMACTVNFEVSVDNTTWTSIPGLQAGTNISATSTTAIGVWSFNVAAYTSLRARISGYSGSATVTVTGYVGVVSGGGAGTGICGATKGATTIATCTVSSVDSDHNALDVYIRGGSSSSSNLAQVNGHTVLEGNGPTGNGSQRVTIANDNAALPVTQSGSWTVSASAGIPTIPTYSASTPFFTAASSATDMFELYGANGKTVKVLKIFCNYRYAGSSITINDFYVVTRSGTANSGSFNSTAKAKLDVGNATTPSATSKYYTANPTITTTPPAQIDVVSSHGSTTGYYSNESGSIVLFDADKFGQPIVLNSATEGVMINNNGATLPGTSPVIQFTAIFTEQ